MKNLFPNRLIYQERLEPSTEIKAPNVCEQLGSLSETIDREALGTDRELQLLLARERQKLVCETREFWYSSQEGSEVPGPTPEMKKMYEKVKAVTNLQYQIDLGLDGSDIHMHFTYNGQTINYSYQEGEGAYLHFSIGDKSYGLNMNGFPEYCECYFTDSQNESQNGAFELTDDATRASEVNNGLDTVIAAMTDMINQKPVYRRLKSEHPDIIYNDGLNVRNDNGHQCSTAPLGTYFQVISSPDSNNYVFAYFVNEAGEIESGWVHQNFLDEPQDSYDKSQDTRIEREFIGRMRVNTSAASNGGLNLRETYGTSSPVIGKIPVGTVVNVIRKSSGGVSQWAEVSYQDPTNPDRVITGWACIYMQDSRYMDRVE